MNSNSPWVERDGAEGVIVAPTPDGRYPQATKGHVLVLLDDDPLCPDPERLRWWTCQVTLESVTEVSS